MLRKSFLLKLEASYNSKVNQIWWTIQTAAVTAIEPGPMIETSCQSDK